MLNVDNRVKVNKIIESQLPEFLINDFPKATEFFKQYYISQEAQGAPSDLISNFDQYIKVDNLVPEVVVGVTILSENISDASTTIVVSSTKGYPAEYGLLKIDDEIITYTGKTDTSFTGCIRGFSGITGYNVGISSFIDDVNKESLIFESTSAADHTTGQSVTNLSVLFIQEFYKKLKRTFLPGLEDNDFTPNLDVGNFIKHARTFYQSKGIEESIRILFKVLYGVEAQVLDLEERLVKPSDAEFIRREVVIADPISGDPSKLVGQTIYKSTDLKTNASVSEVEILTRDNKVYYKLSLFVGFNDRDLIEGTFTIPGKTRVLEATGANSTIITVDSTVGFGESGTVLCGDNIISYTSKSINQFFGCTGNDIDIPMAADLRSDEVIYGYEDGDLEKKVELRITGVLSNFVPVSDISLVEEGEDVYVKNVGESILNPQSDFTYKQIFANSWIYNTSCRFPIKIINKPDFVLETDIDKSSLKVNDIVDITERNNTFQTGIAHSFAIVSSINSFTKTVTLNGVGGFNADPLKEYDIVRRLKKSTSSGIDLKEGNSQILSDTLNVYVDGDIDGYAASNSLPSYDISANIIQTILSTADHTHIVDMDATTEKFNSIVFDNPIEFITGDSLVYTTDGEVIPGLESGQTYYVELLTKNPGKIKLYLSRGLVGNATNIQFGVELASNHTFTKLSHSNKKLAANKVLRKFPLYQDLFVSGKGETPLNDIGMMIDGVQIRTPISEDSIFYGPLTSVEVYNSGSGYDVINPPKLIVDDSTVSSGTTALLEPVVSGSVKNVFVDPHEFDINDVTSISIQGGNGIGCRLEPVVSKRVRELSFDSRDVFFSGGLSIAQETITFTTDHNLEKGEVIYYNSNGNPNLGIGPSFDNTNTSDGTLATGAPYNVSIINTRTIRLYNSYDDAMTGINTIGLSTATNASGIHKFRTSTKNVLQSVKVLNSGSGYSYRKLNVKPSAVSVAFDTINFKNHGFNDGDLVEYRNTDTGIGGLDTDTGYYIMKIDDDSFKLANAGITTTPSKVNYNRKEFVNLTSSGTGYQTFKYPDISVSCQVSYSSTVTGSFNFTPVVTGEITQAYLYEEGDNYGSSILNHEKNPRVEIKIGRNAEIKPIIVGGKIVDAVVLDRGKEYYSLPEIKVETTGITTTGITGNGAILRPVITNGKLTSVVVINGGIGYDVNKTNLYVESTGINGLLEPRVRRLTVDSRKRLGDFALSGTDEELYFGLYGYNEDIANKFNDTGSSHSPIIGWAFDGNPIYGPFGFSKSDELGPAVRLMNPGYKLDITKVDNRPTGFDEGFFTNDYYFDASGDLDVHNGRYCKTPDFPNGVYAYFAGVTTAMSGPNIGKLSPKYPYFIGNTYHSPFISSNTSLSHSFDFNSTSFARNTFPYKVGDPNANNDFIIESNERVRQLSTIESVTVGEIDGLEVLDGGIGYQVGDFTVFDNSGTSGSGLRGQVKSIVGLGISSIETELQSFENAVFTWKNSSEVQAHYLPFIELNDKDAVSISGLSNSIVHLTDSFSVGVTTNTIGLAQSMTSNAVVAGRVDDIYVNVIPDTVSIGSTLKIDQDELVKVLNIFNMGTILRVRRFGPGIAHTYGSNIDILNSHISIPVNTKQFNSKVNDKVYFNAKHSVGTGVTVGGGIIKEYKIGDTISEVSIPTRAIYLPNHPFETGQKLIFSKRGTANSLIVGDTEQAVNNFSLPNVTTDQSTVYAINKGQNYVGLVTQVGAATTSEGLFFKGNESDDYEYLLESTFEQVTGDIDKIVSKVTTKTAIANTESHNLTNGDVVTLNVIPNTVVGVGSTAPLSLIYNEENELILVNRVGFTSAGINTATNTITIPDHGYSTGDKVFYNADEDTSSVGGLPISSSYFVYELNRNQFNVAKTLKDVLVDPPLLIGISSTGAVDHTVAAINPQIDVIKNSKLTFNVSDSSLLGYDLKVFYDQEFKNEFISSEDDSNFNVTGVGTVGVGTESTVSLAFSKTTPSRLYYALEKSGYISTADTTIPNYSEINFIDSAYSGDYKIFGITSDTFKVSPRSIPELLSYKEDQCDTLEYSTESKLVVGAVKDVKIISKGFDYKQLPKFSSIVSLNGKNANIVALSTSIGRINSVRIVDIGYEYSSDRTLSPEAFVSPVVRIDNLDTIVAITVTDGGNEYLSAPDILVYDSENDIIVDDTSLLAKVPNQTISEVEVIAPVQGLNSVNHKIITINNSNGIGINSMEGGGSGIVTCTLETPIGGFRVSPFETGDEVFVEGVELFGEVGIGTQSNVSAGVYTGGDGYNSSNYQFRFFKVEDYINSDPAVLKYSIAGLTTNPGIAKTYQSGYANIVNKKDYPILESVQERGNFIINEPILVEENDKFLSKDLKISDTREDFIKIDGTFRLKAGYRIKGETSNVSATITSIVENKARFEVDYANRQEYGWTDDSGKLNEDIQVIPNNDYFQNLSYSVKSPITWDQFVDPVNRLVHPSGLKNFADTSVETVVGNVGVGTSVSSVPVIVVDVLGERRVDTINNFDLAKDYDSRGNKSKFVTFENVKLTDYTKCKTNRVLLHDDISGKFSSKGLQDLFTEIEEIDTNFSRYLIQIVDADTQDIQLSDLLVLTTTNDAFLVEKTSDWTSHKLGDFEALSDSFQRKTLNFNPIERYDRDHDIKIYKTDFTTNRVADGTNTIGSIDFKASNVKVAIADTDSNNNVSGFTTTILAQFDHTDFNGFYASVVVQDDITKDLNYGEVVVDFDGYNLYYTESYIDTLNISYSSSQVGVLTARFDSGTIYFECENQTKREINVSTNVVGIGTTTAGIGTYRFAVPGQPVGAERSGRLESTYHTGTSTPILVTRTHRDIDSSVKSFVRVSNETGGSAMHQVVSIQDGADTTTIQYPFTGATSSGLGTFGTVTVGSYNELNFYPDTSQTTLIEVQAYNEVLNTINDFANEPLSLKYGPLEKGIFLSSYDGVNGTRANKVNFDLTFEGIPIYSKVFNPADLTLDQSGFNIPNHFFNNNEEIKYIPGSTFVGIGSTAVSIGSTANNVGVVTDIMPSTLYVKAINSDNIELYTRKEYITSGLPITLTGVGEGNAHKFEMTKKLSKTVIGLDGIIQQPITFTAIEHNLEGAIGIGNSQFVLSGISSVQPRDVLKIGPEYMKVEQIGFSSLPEGIINKAEDVALGICTLPVVKVRRGSLGIGATEHVDGAAARVHRGSFNIVDSTAWFLDPPKGNTRERRNETNLPYVRAEYSGRTFLRQNYTTNMVFDDISDNFTGIGRTYTMTVGGANTITGVGIGNGILFINGVFQTPLTVNNAGNNYEFDQDTNVGVSSVVFTGISSENGQMMQSEFDINQNQLPRGGLIVSMGSTPGLGYAPLVGAKVRVETSNNANKFANGSVDGVVGVGTSSGINIGIETAAYDNTTGIITVTTNSVHGFGLGYPNTVKLKQLEFKCPTYAVGTPTTGTAYNAATGLLTLKIANHNLTSGDSIKIDKEGLTFSCTYGSGGNGSYPRTTDPAHDKYLTVTVVDADTFTVNVLLGISPTNTDTHTFVSASPNCIRSLQYVGVTTSFFQDERPDAKDKERSLPIVGIVSERSFEVKVGITSIPHIYHGGGYAYEFWNDLTMGSGYREPVAIGVTDIAFTHKFVSSANNAITANTGTQYTPSTVDYYSASGELVLTVGTHNLQAATEHTADSVAYSASTGKITVTMAGHPFVNGDLVKIKDHSISLKCEMDNYGSTHTYPRPSDPISGKWVSVTNKTTNTFKLDVGTSPEVTFTPTDVDYDPVTGLMEMHIGSHTLTPGTSIKIATNSLGFTCDVDNNTSTKTYPRSSDPYNDTAIKIESVTDTTITVQVLSVQPSTNTTRHTFVSAVPNCISTGGNYTHQFDSVVTGGILKASNTVTIVDNSLTFTCSRDNYGSNHPYPRTTDPASGETLGVERIANNSFTVNVGSGGGGGREAIVEAKVAKNRHKFVSASAGSITVGSGGVITPTNAKYDPATGELIIIKSSHGVGGASTITPSSAAYNKTTGVLTITKNGHGFAVNDRILIEDNSLTFTCTKDGNVTKHHYPRPTDYASGRWLFITNATINTFRVNVNPNPSYEKFDHTFVQPAINGCIQKSNETIVIAANSLVFTCEQDQHQSLHGYPRVTDPAFANQLSVGKATADTFRIMVGKSPAGTGGALDLIVKNGGAKYVNPELQVPDPIYENMPVVGISRLGVGRTTDTGSNLLMNVAVGAARTNVGIARSMFEISEFQVARSGHSFKVGDKFKPQGLVVDKRLQKPIQEFELEVVETFSDFFSSWQFGELDFIDSISLMQTGSRRRFPLFFNGQLLSFEVDPESALSDQIDLNAVLLIFVNGVLQTPNVSYQFEGGTTFTFTEAPMASDKVDVFFYKGEEGVDIEIVDVNETIKIGDDIQLIKHPDYLDPDVEPFTETQETTRPVKAILGSDLVETTIYTGVGITEFYAKPLDWTKQKTDVWIKGDLISKSREQLEPQIYPTAKVIASVGSTTGETTNTTDGIFVDDAESFFYEEAPLHLKVEDRYGVSIESVDALLLPPANFVGAAITAIVSNKGDIESLVINGSGSGYVGAAITLSIAAPIGVGIGTTERNKYAVTGISTFAEANATVTNGEITGYNITNIGLGYTHSNPPQVVIPKAYYGSEKILEIKNVQGFAGIITGISTSAGTNGHPLALRFAFRADKPTTDLQAGHYVYISNTPFTVGGAKTDAEYLPFNDGSIQPNNNRFTAGIGGDPTTSVDKNDNEIIAIGSGFMDNVYKVSQIAYSSGENGEIVCNIKTTNDVIAGLAATGFHDAGGVNIDEPTNIGLTTTYGKISWGRLYNVTRADSPISIGVTGLTVNSGLTTFPTIQRRSYARSSLKGLRNTGAIRIQIS